MPHRYSDLWRSLAKTLLGAPEFTPAEVAAEAGVDLQQARRLWRALGFPAVPDDDRIFTRTDVAMLRAATGLLEQEVAEPEVLLQLTRVTGQALARVAEAQVAATLVSNELGTRLLAEPCFVLRNLRPLALQGIGRVDAWVLRRPPGK